MSAIIVIDDGTNPPAAGSVDEPNTFLATVFHLSNFDDTNVLGWSWTLLDKPEGSSAAISSATSAIAAITPDVAGSYLIQLRTFRDAGRTIPDDADQQVIGIRYTAPRDWLIPAAGQTSQLGGLRGWAAQVNHILIDMHASATAASMQGAYDGGASVLETTAKGPIALSSVQDVSLLTLSENTLAAASVLMTISSTATNRTAALLKLTGATPNKPAIEIDTGGHAVQGVVLDNITNLTDLVRGVSITSATVSLLRRSLLKFSGDEDAAINLEDVASGNGKGLTLGGGNTTDNAGTGGAVEILGGDNGNSLTPGDINIGVTRVGAIKLGLTASKSTPITAHGAIEIDCDGSAGYALLIDSAPGGAIDVFVDQVGPTSDLFSSRSVTSSLFMKLRRSLLEFSGDEDATIDVHEPTSGAGKALLVQAGPASTGAGGAATLKGGQGATGAGGAVSITGGLGSGAAGGAVSIQAGTGTADGAITIGTSAGASLGLSKAGKLTTVNGKLAAAQDVSFTGTLTPAGITGTTTDWAPTDIDTAFWVRVSPSSVAELISILLASFVDGRILILENVGVNAFSTRHDDGATGTAAARFINPDGLSAQCNPKDVLGYMYDGTTQRFRLIFSTGARAIPTDTVSGTTYTILNSDHGRVKRFTNAAGCTVTVDHTVNVGVSCGLFQDVGAGQVGLSDDGAATTFIKPASSATPPATLEEGSTLGITYVAAATVLVTGGLA